MMENGHGTHCAGSATGQNAGIARNAHVHSVRVLNNQGSGTLSGVISGIDHVANNQVPNECDVASLSLGGGLSEGLNAAATNAVNNGVIVVVAAGNSAADCIGTSPASAEGVVTVAASTLDDTRLIDVAASFTNYGTCVDIFAPGVNITSSWYTSPTAYATISGTSMATPLTAGSIALYCEANGFGNSHPSQIEAALLAWGTPGIISMSQRLIDMGTPNLMIYDRWNSTEPSK